MQAHGSKRKGDVGGEVDLRGFRHDMTTLQKGWWSGVFYVFAWIHFEGEDLFFFYGGFEHIADELEVVGIVLEDGEFVEAFGFDAEEPVPGVAVFDAFADVEVEDFADAQ